MSRKCGQCRACCEHVEIVVLSKPAGTLCPHHTGGYHGCSLHRQTDAMPQTCASFKCMWLDGHFADKDRPDKIGVMFIAREHRDDLGAYVVVAVETHERASLHGRAASKIDRMSRGTVVVVVPTDPTKNMRVLAKDPQIARRVRNYFSSRGVKL